MTELVCHSSRVPKGRLKIAQDDSPGKIDKQ